MKRRRALAFALLLLLARLAHATEDRSGGLYSYLDERGFEGSLRLDYFSSSKDLDATRNFVGATAQVKLAPALDDNWNAKVEWRAHRPDLGSDGATRGELLEAYATGRFGDTDVRIGKQIVVWGRADALNPTDNLTPRDYTLLLPFDEDQRTGVWAVKIDRAVIPDHTLTLYASPFFEPSRVPLAVPAGVELNETAPARTASNAAAGVKWDRSGGDVDWSLSYFRGLSLLPGIHPVAAGPPPRFELRYPRIRVLGGDAAANVGRYGVRAEVAYVDTGDAHNQDPSAINPFLYYVIGADRTFGADLNINLQFVGRHVRRFADPAAVTDPAARAAALDSALINGQRDADSYGLTLRASDMWRNQTLRAELQAFIDLTRDGAYLRPLLTYAFTDRVKGTVGGEYYTGPSDSLLGRLEPNRNLFVELRYSF